MGIKQGIIPNLFFTYTQRFTLSATFDNIIQITKYQPIKPATRFQYKMRADMIYVE